MAVVLSALASTAAPAFGVQRSVPAGFVGAVLDGPALNAPQVDTDHEGRVMARSGVESVRVSANWALAQPYKDMASVPTAERGRFEDVGGVPTDWTRTDQTVGLAAARGMRVLPVVERSPGWAAMRPGHLGSPPADDAAYARFAAALAARYGRAGGFWTAHPELPRRPVREWQLWNEPNLETFWSEQPFAAHYVRLIRRARRAIRAVDPEARIVLAGLTYDSWVALRRIYEQPLARRGFDVVALHPYTSKLANLELVLRRARRRMDRQGDDELPIWVTEMSWTSAAGKIDNPKGWERTEAGQATQVRSAYRRLALRSVRRPLKLERVFWYTWMTRDANRHRTFDWAGLRRGGPEGSVSKPALGAFRRTALALEGCRSKSSTGDCRR